ncbi:RHS repeat domain-containing protein [Luteibacter yeojuensis]|uniref:YD repeat-containing protein n=1 Tax=Luteibacter yeojuensis TaxID=345309 RepID=A0A0F3KPM5_9GAMM|nr:RHS repeat domain-containing protein [Luteibacter yeojuensis]KJV33220.1 hypothetical protein VI08_11845 [Luteibacter yeojuensis]
MSSDQETSLPAAEAGETHSTALNFFSSVAGRVDPRTGAYIASVDLQCGEGNTLRGPSFTFHLGYDALAGVDEGFGLGWLLRTTTVDRTSRMVTLDSGESFKARPLTPGQVVGFEDRKLATFTLTPGPNVVTATLAHISGHIEELALPGNRGNVLRPHRLVNPAGDSLTLEWVPLPRGGYGLGSVKDDNGVLLLGITYNGANETEVALHMGQGEPVVLRFHREGNRLVRIELPTLAAANAERVAAADEAAWTFDYRQANAPIPVFLIRRLVSPTGLVETVAYDDAGLAMPAGAPLTHMPVVTEHRIASLAAPDVVLGETHYRFSRTNFTGFDVVANWAAARDQLIHLIGQGSFTYWGEETRYNDGKPAIVVRRDFNQFHLLTKETTTRGKVTSEVTLRYGDLPGKPFADQPADFQLVHQRTTRQWHADDPGTVLETNTQTDYDDQGNVMWTFDSTTEVVEAFDHYPAEGLQDEKGEWLCPPDPWGIIRRLKSHIVQPGRGGGPLRTTRYRYGLVPTRDGARSYVQCVAEEAWVADEQGERRQSLLERAYVTDRSLAHGCLARETLHERWGTSETLVDYLLGTEGWTTRRTLRTYDGLEAVSSETLALVNGLVLATENMFTKTVYGYDSLGRMVSETASPGVTDYEATRTWAYQLSNVARWVEACDVLDVRRRSWLDERGLEITGAEALGEGAWFEMVRYTYDALGQRVSATARDELQGGELLELTTRYDYDDWGREARILHPDGSATVSDVRLVRGTSADDVWLRETTWREGGDEVQNGAITETDPAGRVVRRTTGELEERWAYDGLGRVVEETATWGDQQRQTRRAWDSDDREVETTLPDGSRVRRTYVDAPDVPRSLSLAVVGPEDEGEFFLGVREFDGLARITREKAGSLETRQTYVEGQLAPVSTRRPSGVELRMAYDRRLGESLLSTTVGELGPRIAQAEYDRRSGLPTQLGAEAGTIHITPDRRGRLTKQKVQPVEGATHDCVTDVSPAGIVLGKVGQDGVSGEYRYDALGRLSVAVDGDLQTTLGYDALSRAVVRATQGPDGDTLAQRAHLDTFGRVDEVSWLLNDVPVRRLALVYRADNKVTAKKWYGNDGALCRDESFDYDLRGRLVLHTIDASTDSELPADDEGKPFVRQAFLHDAIDNLLTVATTRSDGTVDELAYDYDTVDRDRAIRVRRSTAGKPGETSWTLSYDADGNLVDDGRGMRLAWDGAGRLASMTLPDGKESRYQHGPGGRPWIVDHDAMRTWRFYEEGALVYEYSRDGEARRFIRVGGKAIAETRLAQAVRTTWLLGTDPQGSVIVTHDGATGTRTYDAFGVLRDISDKVARA